MLIQDWLAASLKMKSTRWCMDVRSSACQTNSVIFFFQPKTSIAACVQPLRQSNMTTPYQLPKRNRAKCSLTADLGRELGGGKKGRMRSSAGHCVSFVCLPSCKLAGMAGEGRADLQMAKWVVRENVGSGKSIRCLGRGWLAGWLAGYLRVLLVCFYTFFHFWGVRIE